MKLPIQETPSYTITLPVTQQEVNFRPFLVKEQRNLILAREGKDTKEIFGAIKDIIEVVTKERIDSTKLPIADLEFLFLQIRCKSIGETADIVFNCGECEVGTGTASIDLASVGVDIPKVENKITLNDDLMVEMRYLTSDDALIVDGLSEADAIKPILRRTMVRLFDKEEIYDLADFPDSEIDKFIDSLTLEQYNTMNDWISKAPALSHIAKYTCDNCGHKNEILLRGLDNFF